MREELAAANARAHELEQDVERKKLEISYLEQDQDEKDDQITRYVRIFRFRRGFVGSPRF